MTLVTRIFGGKAAVYTKPTSGDPLAPFTNPGANLDKTFFHSDYDYYRRHSTTNVTVTLPTVAAATRNFDANPVLNIKGKIQIDDVLLVNHGRTGEVPNYMVIYNGTELVDGDLVQFIDDANGQRGRYLSHWADTTGIYVRSCGVSSSPGALTSMSFTCTVVVFKPGVASGNVVFDFNSTTGKLVMAKGMFDSDEVLLRAQGQAGDSPYDIQTGKSIDLANGRSRVARSDGTTTDESGYNGSFVAPAGFQGVLA